MLLKNLDLEAGAGRMLVNGSRGVVIGFRDRAEVTHLHGIVVSNSSTPPLRLSILVCIWSSTV